MPYPPADAPDRVAGEVIASAIINALDTAIQTIVTELGSSPKGASADLTARLAVLDALVANKQPLDADLTSLAAGGSTATTWLRALLDAIYDAAGAAASAQAASQPLDADLTAIAALVTTAYGRGLLTDADATAFTTRLTGLLNAAYASKVPNIFLTSANGVASDGTDQTTQFNALLATVVAAGGGEIVVNGKVRCDGQLIVPNDGATPMPSQPPIRIRGVVADQFGSTRTLNYTSTGTLDLRYAGRTDTNVGMTAGSNVITDPAAVAGDLGMFLLHPNIPDRAQIYTVTPGVGYTLASTTLGGVVQPANAFATASAQTATVVGGRIQSLGNGYLEIDHLLLMSGGATSAPFGWSVDTVVNLHDCNINGRSSKTNALCDEDIWVFGGNLRITSPDFEGGKLYDAFQGYGSRVWGNHFDHIRRLLFLCDVSSVWVSENKWWQGCGSNLTTSTTLTTALTSGNAYTSLAVAALTRPVWAGDTLQLGAGTTIQQVTASAAAAVGATSISVTSFTASADFAIGVVVTDYTTGLSAPIEFHSSADQKALPSVISNRFERNRNYTHTGIFEQCSTGVIAYNEVQDSNAANVAYWRFGTGATTFLVIPGSSPTTIPLIDDLLGNTHVVLDPRASQPSVFNNVTTKYLHTTGPGATVFGGDGGTTKVQPDAAQAGNSTILFKILRSALESSNPGATVAEWLNGGGMRHENANATPSTPSSGVIAYAAGGKPRWKPTTTEAITGSSPLEIAQSLVARLVATGIYTDSTTAYSPAPDVLAAYLAALERTGQLASATTSGTRLLPLSGAPVATTAGTAGTCVFYFDPADYAVVDHTTKLNLRLAVLTNDVAPASDITIAMRAISAVSGASGTNAVTLGSAVTGSTVALLSAALTADGMFHAESGDFDVPTAGVYVITILNGSTIATGGTTIVKARLFVKNI